MKIAAVTPTEQIPGTISSSSLSVDAPASDVSFAGVLGSFVEHTAALDRVAADKVQGLASGLTDDLHGTMIAAKEAEISVKLLGNVRNKLLDAFHELWRTNV